MVAPGEYTATMSVGGQEASQTFWVRMDPRVVAEGIDEATVLDQVDLALQVRDALSEARLAAKRITDAKDAGDRRLGDEVDEIERALVTQPRRYSKPMLIDQLQYLYGNLMRADQEPGRDAYERYDVLNSELEEHIQRLERLLRANAAADGGGS